MEISGLTGISITDRSFIPIFHKMKRKRCERNGSRTQQSFSCQAKEESSSLASCHLGRELFITERRELSLLLYMQTSERSRHLTRAWHEFYRGPGVVRVSDDTSENR